MCATLRWCGFHQECIEILELFLVCIFMYNKLQVPEAILLCFSSNFRGSALLAALIWGFDHGSFESLDMVIFHPFNLDGDSNAL